MKTTTRVATAALLLSTSVLAWCRLAIVADRTDRAPLQGVTVFARNGHIIGLTDSAGTIETSQADFPLSASCIGYEFSEEEGDTLWMTPREVTLQQVDVDAASRPVTRITAYAREYLTGASGSDTVLMYSDYMVEFFTAGKDTKGYKDGDNMAHVRNKRRCQRSTNTPPTGNTGNMEENIDAFTLIQFCYMPKVPRLTEAMEAGASTDVIAGKYGPQTMLRRSGNRLNVRTDLLSNVKNHRMSPWIFKLLGFTIDIDKFDHNSVWLAPADSSTCFTQANLSEMTFNVRIVCKGRWLKKLFHSDNDVSMEAFIEVWPVDVSRLTVEEYKEARKSDTVIPFDQTVIDAHPLPAAYRDMVAGISR